MEFPFDVNAIYPERITILDQNLTTSRKCLGRPDLQHQIATVIDELGKASAKAQQLTAPITSAVKLQSNRHHLYLLKDGESNGGRGVAVGYLKVGFKKLFLLDQHGAHVETEPLCVLDFFVTESLQRHGYGLELFRHMLQHKRVDPVQMAYDRPSPKFLSFLGKHYGLKATVPQVNNFVVFDGFFRNRSAVQMRKIPPRKPEGEIKPYSLTEREAVREEQKGLPWPFTLHPHPPLSPPLPHSSPYSRSLSVGSSPSRLPPRPSLGHGASRGQETSPHSQYIENLNCRARRTRHQDLVALGNACSHRGNSRNHAWVWEKRPSALKLPGLQPVQGESETNTEGEAALLGHTGTYRAPPTLPPLALPPIPGSGRHSRPTSTSLAHQERERPVRQPVEDVGPDTKGQRTQGREQAEDEKDDREGAQGAWSWTVGEGPWTAQWVRHKQEYRSTRPW